MRIKSTALGITVLVIFFGGIAFTTAMNWWRTESSKVPVTYSAGEFAGQYNPADIRGSYTFGEISDLFQIPLADLAAAFNLPADSDAAAFACRDLETIYAAEAAGGMEIGTTSVRLFVALYKSLPFALEDDIFLPSQAVETLKQRASLSSEQLQYLAAHSVPPATPAKTAPSMPSGVETAAPLVTQKPQGEEGESVDKTIKGKTTFQELLDWGIPQEKIEAVIGAPIPLPAMTVKDYAAQQGQEFSVLKTALQALVQP